MVSVLFVAFFMGIILPLFVVVVKRRGKSCGRIVDNSTDRIHDGSERERKRDQRTREEERDAECRTDLAKILHESHRRTILRVEADGDASDAVGVVALVAHATSIRPDALGCKPLRRYFVDLFQIVLSPRGIRTYACIGHGTVKISQRDS